MARQYGTGVTSTDVARAPSGTLTHNGASQTLVTANANRRGLIVSQVGAGAAWLSLGGTAAANTGVRLMNSHAPLRLEGYTGAVSVLGVNTEVISFVEY